MIVYFAISTHRGSNLRTRIALSFDLSEFEVRTYSLEVVPALLAFGTELILDTKKSTTLILSCKPNTFRTAFEDHQIDGWIADGFTTKPPSYREEWASFYRLMCAHKVNFEFQNLSKPQWSRLHREFSHDKPRATPIRLAPGDPEENPWRRNTDINDAIDRAIKKDR